MMTDFFQTLRFSKTNKLNLAERVWPGALHTHGFTLVELVVAVTILGIMVTSLQLVLGQSLRVHRETRERIKMVNQARFAMDRMAMLINETGKILNLTIQVPASSLIIEERTMDTDSNDIIDANNDGIGGINDDPEGADKVDEIKFHLDDSDANNKKLVEILPDYSTPYPHALLESRVLCEYVDEFTCTLESATLVKIKLILKDGINLVQLNTRAIAGKMRV